MRTPRDSVSSWRELCLCLCTSLSKTLSRTALVVTTVVSLIHLDRETRDFCLRLGFGSQPQVFSQGKNWKFPGRENTCGYASWPAGPCGHCRITLPHTHKLHTHACSHHWPSCFRIILMSASHTACRFSHAAGRLGRLPPCAIHALGHRTHQAMYLRSSPRKRLRADSHVPVALQAAKREQSHILYYARGAPNSNPVPSSEPYA